MKGVRMNKTLAALTTAIFFGIVVLFSYPAQAGEVLKRVENEKVCMVTDMHFGKKQIPVEHNGKTYFGCCANCKATLSTDAKSRTAIDPVSGKSIDKASAVIGAREDNSVVYFESERTFKQYAQNGSKPNHSHH